VAMHGSRLYVCDTIINNVLVFDLDSGDARLLSTNLGADALRQPINIAVAPDGTIYVADADRGQVVVFDSAERFVAAFGDPASVSPCDVAVIGDRLAVADLAGNQVEIWDRTTGEIIAVHGEQGSGLGQFQAPTNLAVSPDGTLCVSETHNFRIQRMDQAGNAISAFGGLGTGFGQFTRPKGVSIDPAGRVYVVDAAFSNVQVFSPDDELLIFIGGPGPDVSNLDLPADVEIVSDPALVARFERFVAPGHRIAHLILVSSQFGVPRVNVYGFLDGEADAPMP
jgi:DNA-binding beta-propeller fold protein YncE